MRLLFLFLALAVSVLIPFLIWGEWFEAAFSEEALRSWGLAWGWLAGVLLLAADLFLPVPGTVVMSGLGWLYGAAAGGAMAAAGSWISGALAYALCRKCGDKWAVRLMGADGLEKGRRLFSSGGGGLMVAASRCLPLLPEVVACMAGLTGMPARRFLLALACGSVPMGFIFAWVGAAGHDSPVTTLVLSAAIPLVLYGVALLIMRRRKE
jgi:uncharacterized membrane protein YdjX (TVP38/TMEM64 family)